MGQVAISPSSDPTRSSQVGGTAMTAASMPRLVPQRPTHLHITNLSPNMVLDEKPSSFLPSMISGRDTERRQTLMQDDTLRREVEQLRMEMDILRGQQIQQGLEESPPGYIPL